MAKHALHNGERLTSHEQQLHAMAALPLLVLLSLIMIRWWCLQVACTGRAGPFFDVTAFGAVADGETDNSEAFLRAWKEPCISEGRPAVVVPKGIYLLHPLVFRGPCRGFMELHVSGVLRAPTDLDVFHGRHQWVHFANIDGLLVTGGGTFDGQGALSWPLNDCHRNRDCKPLPASIKLGHVANATVAHVTSLNSKFFHLVVAGSRDVALRRLNIWAPWDSPNTDGVHVQNSRNVNITDSVVGTGDDCVSVGPGSADVSVSRVFCGPGHGLSIGSLGKYPNEEDVRGLRVVNCTLAGTTNGVRIKTWRGFQPSAVSDLLFEDIQMRRVRNPIIIDQEYCPYASCDGVLPSMVGISDVRFRNIRGVSATRVAVKLRCSEAVPCRSLELRDIDLKHVKHGVATESVCANVAGGVVGGTLVPPSCI